MENEILDIDIPVTFVTSNKVIPSVVFSCSDIVMEDGVCYDSGNCEFYLEEINKTNVTQVDTDNLTHHILLSSNFEPIFSPNCF